MPSVVAHPFNPTTRKQRHADLYVFKASLVYSASSRIFRTHKKSHSQRKRGKEKKKKNGKEVTKNHLGH